MTHVLVVDDKEENRYLLEALLGGHGWTVTTARHGAEALAKARQQPPDLIVSDLLMPIMDGYTLLRRWKGDEELARRPFVVYTATYTAAQDEQLALDLGADAFILKPTEPDEFLERLRAVLRQGASGERPRTPRAGDDLVLTYSAALVRKLEEKSLLLEETNRALQRDIAERLQAEEQLRRTRAQLADLIQSVDGIVYEADAHRRRFSFVSDHAERILGYPPSRWREEPDHWASCLHPDDQEPVVASCRDHAARGESHRLEYRALSADNRTVWLRDLVTHVGQPGPAGLIRGVMVDITEQKRMEEQVLRTQRLESLGMLAGGIAHDLNNILAPILMSSDLLGAQEPDEQRRHLLLGIKDSALRGAELIRQILSFARGAQGKRIRMDLARVARDVQRLARDTFPKNIETRLQVAPHLRPIVGDPTQLHQVLMNLAVNARDAMRDGGELVMTLQDADVDAMFAAMTPDVRPGPFVQLQVSDTGTGVPPEHRPRIFELFFTTKPVGEGTGLGLATVQSIVKAHGGFVTLTSEVGVGTTFTVHLPAATDALEGAAPVDATPVPPPRGRGELVVVIDDEERIRDVTRQCLQAHGYAVLVAAHGAEGVARFASRRADVGCVLVDMAMPIMDGSATIAALRSIDPGVRVIGCSGHADSLSLTRSLGGAPLRFLSKPYTAHTLLRTIREALDPPPGEGSARSPQVV